MDEAEDAEIGQLSLFGCYPDTEDAAGAMHSLAAQALHRALPGGRRHALIVCPRSCALPLTRGMDAERVLLAA